MPPVMVTGEIEMIALSILRQEGSGAAYRPSMPSQVVAGNLECRPRFCFQVSLRVNHFCFGSRVTIEPLHRVCFAGGCRRMKR